MTTYTPGGASLKYIITVTNNSGFAVNGATVTDVFPVQISSASWVCAPSAGAVCWSGSGTGNINDSVNLPAGGSVTYTVNATTSTFAAGTLSNTASVAVPAGFAETAPGNNTSTDSDTSTDTEPDIGPPDGISTNPGTGYPGLTMLLNPAIVANGDVGTPDLVYYEVIFSGSSIALDRVQIEISTDGISWIPVFIWGDNIRDTNTNVDTDILLPDPGCTNDPPECDNRSIPSSELYPPPAGTGITIDIDSIPGVVSGTSYSWIQISSYAGGADGPDIDAIQILP